MKIFYYLLFINQIIAHPPNCWKTNYSSYKDTLLKSFLVQYESTNQPYYYKVKKWSYNDDGTTILVDRGHTFSSINKDGYSEINKDFMSSTRDKHVSDLWLQLTYHLEDLQQQVQKNRITGEVIKNILLEKIAQQESKINYLESFLNLKN